MGPFYAVAIALLTILAVGLVGSTRRIGFLFALIAAVLLTPVGGLILAVLSGRPRVAAEAPQPAPKPAPVG